MPDLHLRLLADGTLGEGTSDGTFDGTVDGTSDGTFDVVVAVEPTHRVGELAVALAAHVGRSAATIGVNGHRLDPSMPVVRSGLVCGDVVVLADAFPAGCRASDGSPPPRVAGAPILDPSVGAPGGAFADAGAIAIDVVAGPESGRSVVVRPPGRWVVGRADDATVRIDDPTVSRRHAVLDVDPSGDVTIAGCPGAANGVQVAGVDVAGRAPIDATTLVALGATRLVVRPVPVTVGAARSATFGRVDVHRTPYRPPVVRDRATDPIGPIPERQEPRRLPLVGALAPLAAGLAMYAVTRQLQFLALTLVSPMVIVGAAVEDRRSGRRAARARVAEFRDRLVVDRQRFERLRDAERIERFDAAPDLADLRRRAELRTIDLWARGRDAPDFLAVRLGLGSDTVRFAIELDRGGADDLRAEARAALDGLDRLTDVPITVDLVADAVVAVHGPAHLVDGVVASIVVQAATLHGPDDLVVAGIDTPGRSLGWVRWLPHARSLSSPLPGNHLVRPADRSTARSEPRSEPRSDGDVDGFVDRLLGVAERRREDGATWPRMLVLLDAAAAPDPARLARLLDVAPVAGISVVWSASTSADVPRQAGRSLSVWSSRGGAIRGRLRSTDPDVDDREVEVEQLRPELADRTARALAPLRDASGASLTTTIPRSVTLLDLLGAGRPSPEWVVEHWQGRPTHGLRFPIGLGADGTIRLDLVEDGPHTLVGGTSGSGKSELLQTMVASLAVHHPPTRLNFLFVDYKGGAATAAFDRLPHTVGSVTDLSPELATRALVSLRAELRRRMALLEGRAKDLAELLAVAPDDAPPSLVIVVDEFATLVREVPEFVAGVVDVAQRGRSLGIHLVLATQRPTGSVDENILANTNLRISLRMLDRAESTAIVGVPDAAAIPVPLRGRALLRLGPGRLVALQAAYAGAPMLADRSRPPVLVAPFVASDTSPRDRAPAGPGTAGGGPTQLDAVVEAVVAADRRLGLPRPHRPWRPVLPDVVPLDDVLRDRQGDGHEHPGRLVTIGLLDEPERQSQRPAVVDLEEGGGLLVFGSGGAGATTLLRTVAASVGVGAGTAAATVVAVDVAGRGLAGLRALPHVVSVVTGDDLEALTRHLLLLDTELSRRRRLLAGVGAEHLTAYARDHPDPPPRVVVLVDGFGALTGTLLDAHGAGAGDEWTERVVRLVVEGRQVGIHCVLTADRRGAVPARVHAAVANRLVLRQADETSARDHGVAPDRAGRFGPGRGLLNGSFLVQVASVSPDPSARSQLAAMAEWGRRAGSVASDPSPLVGAALPDRISVRDATDVSGGSVVVASRSGPVMGVADVTGDPVVVDLDGSDVTVCGPPRSGRSTALAALLRGLAGRGPSDGPHAVAVLGSSGSPLRRVVPSDVPFASGAAIVPTLDRLANDVALDDPAGLRVVVVDDADALDVPAGDEPALAAAVERLARTEVVRFVVAIDLRSMSGFTTSPLVTRARRARRLLVLRPDDPVELLQATGVRVALRPGLRLPPGRGVLLVDRTPTVVQVVDALGEPARAERPRGRTVAPHRYSRVDVP